MRAQLIECCGPAPLDETGFFRGDWADADEVCIGSYDGSSCRANAGHHQADAAQGTWYRSMPAKPRAIDA